MYRHLIECLNIKWISTTYFRRWIDNKSYEWYLCAKPFNPKLNAINKHVTHNELGSSQRKCDHFTNPHDIGVKHSIVMELWNDLFLSLVSQTFWRPIDKRTTFKKLELLILFFVFQTELKKTANCPMQSNEVWSIH